MDVRTNFLNRDLVEDVQMSQPTGLRKLVRNTWYVSFINPFMVLKQASRQWYLKFDEVVTANGLRRTSLINAYI